MGFEEDYQGAPPWEIGTSQPAIIRLADAQAFRSPVLDVGCGTGEHPILLAERGLKVWGIDIAPTAIRLATEKLRGRTLDVTLRVLDALSLAELGRTFETILDSALFHVFSDRERPRYADALRQVLAPGGRVYILCFSEEEPQWGGPRRVTQAELRSTFSPPWEVLSIVPERYAHRRSPDGCARAWLTTLRLSP